MSLQPDMPIAASQPLPLTVTVDKEVSIFNPATQTYETKMIPQIIFNPALDCKHLPDAYVSVPMFFMAMALTVFTTLALRKFFSWLR